MRTAAFVAVMILIASLPRLLSAETAAPAITVEDAWARGVLTPGAHHGGQGGGAIYVTFRNTGPQAETLVEVASDAAETVRLYEVIQEGDARRMQPWHAWRSRPGAGSRCNQAASTSCCSV